MSSSYREMLERDTQLLWSIQDYFRKRKWLDVRMSQIISKNPWQDVVIVVWFFSAIALVEIGFLHFWVTAANLLFALMMRNLFQATRPMEIDRRLQPLTDTNAESYGFPSVETYMAVVVMGHLTVYFQSIMFVPIAFVVVFIVGVSRLYSRSRFPHQIFASWFLGIVGLLVATSCCKGMDLHKMDQHHHYTCLIIIGAIFAGFMALAVENNDSRLVYIPKKDFIEIIAGIINMSSDAVKRREGNTENIDLDGNFTGKLSSNRSRNAGTEDRSRSTAIAPSPRSVAARRSRMRGRNDNNNRTMNYGVDNDTYNEPFRSKRETRDSFYFLQKSMEEREEYSRKLASGDSKLKMKHQKLTERRNSNLYSYVGSLGFSFGLNRASRRMEYDDIHENSTVVARKRRLVQAMRSARYMGSDENDGATTDYYSGSEGDSQHTGSSGVATSPRSDHEYSFT